MSGSSQLAGTVAGGTVQRTHVGGEIPPELDSLVAGMVADLAGRLGVAPTEISVISAEEVVWGDASLGCPQPGMEYAQVPTDGMRVILLARGATYDYRSGGDRDPFLCETSLSVDESSRALLELTEDGVVKRVTPPDQGDAQTKAIDLRDD